MKATGGVPRPRGQARPRRLVRRGHRERPRTASSAGSAALRSPGSSGSILSIGSSGSILSIGSTGSILSIGSAGSILSIGSVGCVASVFSAFSAASVGSLMSAGSRWTVRGWRSAGQAQDADKHRRAVPASDWLPFRAH